jgi:hypothetical protein
MRYRKTQAVIMKRSGLYPVADVAQAVGVKPASIYTLLRSGELRGVQQGRAWWVELASAVEHWRMLPPIAARLLSLRQAPEAA